MKNKNIDFKSFIAGIVFASIPLLIIGQAQAYDLKKVAGIGKSLSSPIKNLSSIKRNLEKDVKFLRVDASTLFSDKDKLMSIKNQLQKLSTETKKQITSITALVKVVENHIVKTRKDISSTAKHVADIDGVKNALTRLK
jgi:hypothetical protein